METNLTSPCGLYPHLLGASWEELEETVRRLHSAGAIVHAAGTFRVRHGHNKLARLLVRLAGLPAAMETVAVRLIITPRVGGEEWRRTFAGRPLVSWQGPGPNSLLAERIGLLELRFRLEVAGGALLYRTHAVFLRLGPLRIPLPRCLIPRVAASEKSAGDGDQAHIAVEMTLPWVGLVIAYEGTLTVGETRQ
jgi:hypothetical protein